MELETELTKVTVFSDRAQLFRRVTVQLKPGEHSLLFGGLWEYADRNSLQVATGKGGSKVTLRCVQFIVKHFTEDIRPKRAELNSQMEKLSEEKEDLDDALQECIDGISHYGAILAKYSNHNAEKFLSTHVDFATTMKILQLCDDGEAKYMKKKREVEKKITEKQKEINEVRQKLTKLGRNDILRTSKDVAEVQVLVTSKEAIEIILQLSYMVRNASWKPLYDLRANSKDKTLALTYNAMLQQHCGEDWKDVELELSTAKAHFGANPPKCEPMGLNFKQAAIPELGDMSNFFQAPMQQMIMTNVMPTNMMMPAASAPGGGLASLPPAPEFRSAASQSAAVNTSTTSATYTIDGLSSIKGDNEPVRVVILQQTFPIYFRYSAVPKMDSHVYLKVKATNTTQFQLLPGNVNVFSDNQFVSSSKMDHVSPDEEFWTFLGVDDALSCTRHKIYRRVSDAGGMFSGKRKRVDFKYQFKIKNTKKSQEELVIWDQLPIVEDKKITSGLITPSKEKDPHTVFKINEVQFIEWFYDLKGGESQTVDYEFYVEYPAEERLVGLESEGSLAW